MCVGLSHLWPEDLRKPLERAYWPVMANPIPIKHWSLIWNRVSDKKDL
jgi:hypothetical protein